MWEYHITDSNVVEMTTTGSCGSTTLLTVWNDCNRQLWKYCITDSSVVECPVSEVGERLKKSQQFWDVNCHDICCSYSTVFLSMFVWRAVTMYRGFSGPYEQHQCLRTAVSPQCRQLEGTIILTRTQQSVKDMRKTVCMLFVGICAEWLLRLALSPKFVMRNLFPGMRRNICHLWTVDHLPFWPNKKHLPFGKLRNSCSFPR